MVVPHKKVKLVVGPGGEKIKHIQHKSKCRLQVLPSLVRCRNVRYLQCVMFRQGTDWLSAGLCCPL